MKITNVIPSGLGAPLGWVLVAALAGGVALGWASGASGPWQISHLGELLALASESAVVEELLFRGLLLWGCLAVARRWERAHPLCFAVVASSLVFGFLHLVPEGPLVAPGADLCVAASQAVLKVVQATLFGVVLASLVVRSPWAARPIPACGVALVAPAIVHALFDVLYFGPLLLAGGTLPTTYLTGNPADMVPMGVSTLLLFLAVFVTARADERPTC